MAVITGTSANNTLSGGAADDQITGLNGSDTITGGGGADTIVAGPAAQVNTALFLNWSAAAGDESSIAGGFTQNTGGVNATVTYTDTGGGTGFTVESSDTQYVAGGEPFSTTSAGSLAGTGLGPTSTVGVSFAGVAGAGYQNEVMNVRFRINDIDAGGWQDIITIRAFDAAGNAVNFTITPAGNDTVSPDGTTITAGATSDATSSAAGSALVTIPGPVQRFEIVYSNGSTAGQALNITNVHFDAQPVDNDSVSGGNGNDTIDGGFGNDILNGDGANDSILGGSGNDTLNGGTGNDVLNGGTGNDSVTGGDGVDSILVNVNEGVDTIAGSEGGTDTDTLTFGGVASGAGVTVTYTANEAGGYSFAGGGSGTFTQIETLVTTAGDDVVNASVSTVGVNVSTGAGADSITGGSGNDTVNAGTGTDTLAGGAGNDSLLGGDDADRFVVDVNEGVDTITGGEGGTDSDTLVFGGVVSGAGVTATWTANEAGTYSFGGGGTGTFSQVEIVNGTAGNDTFNAAATTNGVNIDAGAGTDSLTGGTGADTLTGGTGADSLNGGAGNDLLSGGDDADTITVSLNQGVDTITGGEGGTDSDTLTFGGVAVGPGVSVTFSGNEAGSYSFGGGGSGVFSQIEALNGTDGDDSFDAAATTSGVNLSAGAGADTLIGGSGNDTLTGGTGSDQINAGAGADVISSGDDQDTITLTMGEANGDAVDGGEGGTDFDVLTLVGKYTIAYNPGDPESGTINWRNGDTTTFTGIEQINFIPCFTPGTTVETLRGPVRVEDIRPGDLVLTRDSGYRPVRWVGRRRLTAPDLAANPALQPVRIAAGALGQALPARDMVVSPQHRMLLSGPAAELLSGEAEVLAAALHLTFLPGVTREKVGTVTYIHILFDAHEIIRADGAWTESFQPGSHTLGDMDAAMRAELFSIFPELATEAGQASFTAARVCLKRHEVRAMFAGALAA